VNRSDILLQVKDAESKAQQIVKEAEDRQRAIISSARKEAATRVNEADEKLRTESDARFAKERESIAAEKQTYLNKGKEEAASVKAMAEERVPKAITHLMQSFERTLDVAAKTND
jgi:V/A-type H+-transporting ATPase subunit G/H